MNVILIGDGDKIIRQYPLKDAKVISNDKIFLLTNSTNFIMPNIVGWSRYDVMKLCEFINIDYSFDGYGYVVSQSIKEGTKIEENSKLDVLLGNTKSS